MPFHRFGRMRPCGLALIFLAAACGDRPSNPVAAPVPDAPAGTTAELDCTAVVATGAVTCGPRAVQGAAFDRRTVGGQGTYVRITSSNVAYAGEVFAFDVVVQNSSNLAMATDDGTLPHPDGVRVVIPAPPVATGGTGEITVANESGRAAISGSEPQDYFQYGGSTGTEIGADGILTSGEVSAVKRWQFSVPASVTTFSFTVWVATHTPPGTIETIAPQVSSVSASPMVPGQPVTITGINFDPTPANNVVNIGGTNVVPSAATATSLTVTVPCVKTGPVAVYVARGTLRGVSHTANLQGFQRTLAVGQVAVVTNAAEVACNEITASGTASRYVVAVYNTSTSTSNNAPVVVSADGAIDEAAAPAETRIAGDRPALDVAAPRFTSLADAARGRAEADHMRFLERNRVIGEELKARFAGDARMRPSRSVSVVAADPVEPPLTRTVRVARIDGANFCRNYTQINANRVYLGGKVAIYEDADNTPAGLKAAANPTMQAYYNQIGAQFDADMEPIIRGNFGDPLRRDAVTDNNGVVVAVFTPLINQFSPGVAGYVVSCDQYPNDSTATTPTNSTSNFGEYFYAYQPTSTGTGYASFTPDSWYWSIRATFIHETKHAAAYSARVANGAPFEAGWLEEGTARHSEELWARNSVYNVGWKANTGYGGPSAIGSIYCDWRREATSPDGPACLASNPRRPSLNMYRHFQGLYNFMVNSRFYSAFGATVDDGSNYYATAWSMVRFATDRYGTSDAQFLTALTQASNTSTANLQARAGVPMAQLMGEWALSLAMDDYPGMTPTASTPQMPTWNMRSIYTGMNSDPLLNFGRQWPLTYTHSFAFGAPPAANIPTLRGGGVAYVQYSGTQSQPQLVKLGGGSITTPAALASTIRVAIGRVE